MDRTSPSSLSRSWAFHVKGPWDPITTPAEDCDAESFLSSGSDEEDYPVTEVLPMDQAEETVPVAEEEPVALSKMASGTSEGDVGHMERRSPSSSSGHCPFHWKPSRLRTSQHVDGNLPPQHLELQVMVLQTAMRRASSAAMTRRTIQAFT
ncbi:uncharacterized protein [Manis javanica]|uniref:uncharacterized protein isoform X2 n=1 Tax=Manis javanica TaxID=9974 RepID=UPI003C6D43FF